MKLFLAILFIFPQVTFTYGATKVTATVELVKGRVTKLPPGALEATKVLKGDKLKEDTSLVTSGNSLVKLSFKSGSTVVLAKEGKIVIREVPDSAKGKEFITLLNGKVRAAVKKAIGAPQENASKLIIKTRTAAVGVRGTEFITVYNAKNQVTSLVTLEGEVAMKKVVKKRGLVKEQAKLEAKEEFTKLDNELSKTDTVIVKKGRYSGVNSNFLKATVPQKISPVQYLALKENKNLEEAQDIAAQEQFSNEQVAEAAEEINAISANDPDPQGSFNEKTGDFAPKAGGVLDTKTGIYIQPNDEAKFDPSMKTFLMNDKSGNVTASGDYIPPKGLELSAQSGFVAVDKDSKNIEEVKKLNANIATSLPTKSQKEEVIEKRAKEIAKEQVSKKTFFLAQDFTFRFGGANYEALVEPSQGENIQNQDFVSDSGAHFYLQWDQYWNSSVVTSLGIGVTSYDFQSTAFNGPRDDEDEGLFQLHASGVYYLNSWFGFRAGLEIKDIFIPRVVVQDSQRFNTGILGVTSRVFLGPELKPLDNSWVRMQLGLYLMAIAETEEELEEANERLTLESATGARFKVEGDFKLFKDWWLGVFIHYDEFDSDLRQDSFSQSINATRNTRIQDAQVGLSFIYHM